MLDKWLALISLLAGGWAVILAVALAYGQLRDESRIRSKFNVVAIAAGGIWLLIRGFQHFLAATCGCQVQTILTRPILVLPVTALIVAMVIVILNVRRSRKP